MGLIAVDSGTNGEVFYYQRPNNRVPARDYLEDLPLQHRRKFQGQFHQICVDGTKYANPHRFKPLHGPGKGLWEFKEHDGRIYVIRDQLSVAFVRIVLLCGWCKDKAGRSLQEENEITRAHNLRMEHNAAA